MVYTSLDQPILDYKEPLHALYAAKKLLVTDHQTNGHRHFKSSALVYQIKHGKRKYFYLPDWS